MVGWRVWRDKHFSDWEDKKGMMRHSLLDILFYLFNHVLPMQANGKGDFEQLVSQLTMAGFNKKQANRAIDWFCQLGRLSEEKLLNQIKNPTALRVFSVFETRAIDEAGINFLRFLWCDNLLDKWVIEKIIDLAIALDEKLNLAGLAWVAIMVVINAMGDEGDNKLRLFLQPKKNLLPKNDYIQ